MSSPSTNQQYLQASPPQQQPFQPPPPPPPPSFQPFFTLISPTPSNPSHAHPHVHYVFADDPMDPTLDLPPPNGRDRVVTVDIDFDEHHGAFVREAHSLSRDFQLVEATVKEAPQMAGEEGKGGQMLVIEGVELGLRGVKASAGVAELARVFGER
ncbi:hypothetical protein K440DRAFT_93405 [Wilcoxina mikolae CBS 423.85]|nr:hypothetical protein K440DRAFT_93405 [Wilcoxina mikolae CBS 423.85]